MAAAASNGFRFFQAMISHLHKEIFCIALENPNSIHRRSSCWFYLIATAQNKHQNPLQQLNFAASGAARPFAANPVSSLVALL